MKSNSIKILDLAAHLQIEENQWQLDFAFRCWNISSIWHVWMKKIKKSLPGTKKNHSYHWGAVCSVNIDNPVAVIIWRKLSTWSTNFKEIYIFFLLFLVKTKLNSKLWVCGNKNLLRALMDFPLEIGWSSCQGETYLFLLLQFKDSYCEESNYS